jgi:multidrug efflux pump subunit AcrA (membrane-fusion protein)
MTEADDIARARLLADFKALPIEQQTSTYKDITAAFAASKEARRQQLEAEIRALGFTPGEGKKKLERKKQTAGGAPERAEP